MKRAIAVAWEQFGFIDWIVNAVGVGYYAPLEESYPDQWRKIIETNLIGLANVLASISDGQAHPVRHFVQIGSLASKRPSRTPGNSVYAATKVAGDALFQEQRTQLRRAGSRTKFTMITPGFIGATRFVENYFQHVPHLSEKLLGEFEPLSPHDVATCVDFALDAPDNVEIGEIVVRPNGQSD